MTAAAIPVHVHMLENPPHLVLFGGDGIANDLAAIPRSSPRWNRDPVTDFDEDVPERQISMHEGEDIADLHEQLESRVRRELALVAVRGRSGAPSSDADHRTRRRIRSPSRTRAFVEASAAAWRSIP